MTIPCEFKENSDVTKFNNAQKQKFNSFNSTKHNT